jgi:hypothetical protein
MVQGNWRSPKFWRWWWRSSAPGEVRAAVYVLGLALVLGGGWLAATQLTSANASVNESAAAQNATAFPAVRTVRIVRQVPKVEVKTRTRTDVISTTRTITVANPLVQTVVNERTVTDVQPTPKARTVTRTVGYTLVRTVTQTQTETAPPVTVTQTLPAVVITVVRTVTVHH